MIGVLERVARRIRTTVRKRGLAAAQARILGSPPLSMRDAPLTFVSLVSHADLLPYLCAVKSIYVQVGEGRVVVIDDGTLTPDDRRCIGVHVPVCEFVRLEDVDVGECPRGGCWERLNHILTLTEDQYVIQVDSDTITRGPVEEVVAAYRQNRAFLLCTNLGQAFEPVARVAELVSQFTTGREKIGCQAEILLPTLPDAAGLRYARGSAGFAGFARGGFGRERLSAFSRHMRAQLGTRWEEWGSEQVASNFVVANSPGSVCLSYDSYSCFEPWIDAEARMFLHFYGTYRYDRGTYRRHTLALTESLGRLALAGGGVRRPATR